jgi:hypothetical protein
MNPLVIIGVTAAGIALYVYGNKAIQRAFSYVATRGGESPFEKCSMLNRTEHTLYRKLIQIAPAGSVVLTQVQLSAFIRVDKSVPQGKERWKFLNRIIRLSVDFLIVHEATMTPMMGIELDGPTHNGAGAFMSGQKDADLRKTQAFQSANLPLLRIPVKGYNMDFSNLESQIRKCLEVNTQKCRN